MFDIGFVEMLVIAVVALLVIGPERLPETVRTVGLWIGRLKRSLRDTRSELERQLGTDDIRRQLHNEQILRNLEATRRDLEKAMLEGGGDDAKEADNPALPDNSDAGHAPNDTGPDDTGPGGTDPKTPGSNP